MNHASCGGTYGYNHSNMNCAGWSHLMEFWAYSSQRPGTIRIAVGQAWHPHRMLLNHPWCGSQSAYDQGVRMDCSGWHHKMSFWVYPDLPGDAISVKGTWMPLLAIS